MHGLPESATPAKVKILISLLLAGINDNAWCHRVNDTGKECNVVVVDTGDVKSDTICSWRGKYDQNVKIRAWNKIWISPLKNTTETSGFFFVFTFKKWIPGRIEV